MFRTTLGGAGGDGMVLVSVIRDGIRYFHDFDSYMFCVIPHPFADPRLKDGTGNRGIQ